MDGTERARLLRVALEVVAGDRTEGLEIRVHGDEAELADADGFGFRIGHRQVLQRGRIPFLETAIEFCVDGLCEMPPLWGLRLPLCPVHPDEHALTVEVEKQRVVGVCPEDGVVRVVPY